MPIEPGRFSFRSRWPAMRSLSGEAWRSNLRIKLRLAMEGGIGTSLRCVPALRAGCCSAARRHRCSNPAGSHPAINAEYYSLCSLLWLSTRKRSISLYRCLARKARPEWVLRYRSKSKARCRSVNAVHVRYVQGR